jgi:hypothetical protein
LEISGGKKEKERKKERKKEMLLTTKAIPLQRQFKRPGKEEEVLRFR